MVRLFSRDGLAAVVALVAGLAAHGSADAVSAPEISLTDRAEVTLIADRDVAAPGDRVTVALVQYLSPGWHSYWRNPGDSGMETTIAWSGFAGAELPVAFTDIEWPTPEALPVPPLMNYGFKDQAVLISAFDVPKDWPAGEPIDLEAQADWLVCEEICVPERQLFTLSIPTGAESAIDTEAAQVIAEGRSSQPAPFSGVARYEAGEGVATLFIAEPALAEAVSSGGTARFFAADWGVGRPADAQSATPRADGLLIEFPRGEAAIGDALRGVVTVTAKGEAAPLALEIAALEGAPPAVGASGSGAESGGSGGGSLASQSPLGLGLSAGPLAAMLLAFLGGVVLNLMPCVFPVLALKAMSLARGAEASTQERLGHGLAYAGGVLTLFLGFAAALIAFKEAGAAVGWGFQLQSPLVVAGLALLVFGIGLNFAGAIEIGGVSLSGGAPAKRASTVESYLTGALAAVVASPCTAPFMGAALGYALTQSVATTLLVFGALGVGFATPIVILAAAPGVARRLPRPGAWMETFRQALAFPMFLTAAWLVWVLGAQAGLDAVLALLSGFVFLALAAWAWRLGARAGMSGRIAARAIGVAALVGALALPALWSREAPAPEAAVAAKADVLSLDRLQALRADGRAVFVNVTADWCITCKVNERMVLSGSTFDAMLAQADAVYLKGDWTRRDAALGDYLREYGRVGVPLYVVYRPGRDPEILPQILTESILRSALGV